VTGPFAVFAARLLRADRMEHSMNKSETQPKQPPLPANYSAAKMALARCASIDECKDYADRAQALAVYAAQAKDKTLLNDARRIRARAIRREGELLKEIEPAKGGDRKSTGGRPPFDSRKSVAQAAGLSENQQKTALRVANVPEEQFETQVESDSPPTVQALAEQGTTKRPKGSGQKRTGTGMSREQQKRINASADKHIHDANIVLDRGTEAEIEAWRNGEITLTAVIDKIKQREAAAAPAQTPQVPQTPEAPEPQQPPEQPQVPAAPKTGETDSKPVPHEPVTADAPAPSNADAGARPLAPETGSGESDLVAALRLLIEQKVGLQGLLREVLAAEPVIRPIDLFALAADLSRPTSRVTTRTTSHSNVLSVGW
jgi:hypothetical protein